MIKYGIPLLGILALGQFSTASAGVFGGIDFPQGVSSFADQVVSFNPGADVSGDYLNTANALGIPNYVGNDLDNSYLSLGDQGVVVLRFVDNALMTSGDSTPDLWIFEIGDAIEPTSVDISVNGLDWVGVGSTAGGQYGVDIDNFLLSGVVLGAKYSYVRLTDLLPRQSFSPWAGADIDAVGAISSTSAAPLPGVLWLVVPGVAGIAAQRKRRKQ